MLDLLFVLVFVLLFVGLLVLWLYLVGFRSRNKRWDGDR
jgi:hypothetical protein